MTLAELYLEAARVAKMIEGTNLRIANCFKLDGEPFKGYYINFDDSPDRYEACLAIIEGKPVFKGDELYQDGIKQISGLTRFIVNNGISWSWNPPKPKTVMVELLVEDAQYVIGEAFNSQHVKRIEHACRKALGELK
jgi:hypothetical protein